jgi:hypothetical protein
MGARATVRSLGGLTHLLTEAIRQSERSRYRDDSRRVEQSITAADVLQVQLPMLVDPATPLVEVVCATLPAASNERPPI